MSDLNLGLFLRASDDFEHAQYRVLTGLQQVRRSFSATRIYPFLGELIHLHGTLQGIVRQLSELREAGPREIKGVDLHAQRIVFEQSRKGDEHLEFVEDLISWALPHIRETIEEGRTIFEFVEDHLAIEPVGIVPAYVEEGYLLLPDEEQGVLHVLQYALSIITGANERYRSLRTTHVRQVSTSPVAPSPHRLKLELLETHRDLPNPATYYCTPRIDFPFEATLLPVAKRLFTRHLAGAA